jgi:bile acid-coenzyme A ligase
VVTPHPKVKYVAVVGLKDEDLGRRVHAIVESFDEADAPTIEEMTSLCVDHLVEYKAPRPFELVLALSRNEAGKIRRSQLREERG